MITRQQTFTWEHPDKFKIEDYRKSTEGETGFLAEDEEGQIVGFISVWEQDSPAFIHHLFVSKSYQRKGVGKLLMHSLFSWLPLPYRLKCLAKNQNAIAFYLKNNWIILDNGTSQEGDYFLLELRKKHKPK